MSVLPQPSASMPQRPVQVSGVQPHTPAVPPPPHVLGKVHGMQTVPLAPQFELLLVTQLPLDEDVQQPVLHAAEELQVFVH